MAGDTKPVEMLNNSFIDQWDRLARINKPVIAAINGACTDEAAFLRTAADCQEILDGFNEGS